MALRGDPPGGPGRRYQMAPGGYINAADLVRGLSSIAPFEVSVAAHPEKHPDSPSVEADFEMLKAKIDAGATSAITQFFFDNEVFFRFLDRARAKQINIPIVPGILPFHHFRPIARFAAASGISIPAWFASVSRAKGDLKTSRYIGAAVAAEQVLSLAIRESPDFIFTR